MRAPTFNRHVKMTLFYTIILSLIYYNGCNANALFKGDSTCLSSWRYIRTGAKNLVQDQCDVKSWRDGKRPDPLNTDFSFCTRKIITDLSSQFIMPREFKEFLNFIRDSMATCFHKTTGHNFIMSSFQPGSVDPYKEFSCCSMDNCRAELDGISKDDYLKSYSSDDLIFKEPTYNLKYARSWIDQIKQPNWVPCNFNSMVFITNRIMDFSTFNKPEIFDYFKNSCIGYCVELTIILVARPEADQEMLYKYYSNITNNLFVVQDLNCIHKLVGCLLPCINTGVDFCFKEQFSNCAAPTLPPSTTTALAPTPRVVLKKPDSVYVMYVFALSSDLSLDSLEKIRNSLVNPINEFSSEYSVTVSFYLPSNDSTSWINPMEVQKINFNQGDLLVVSHPIDQSIRYPTEGISLAISRYNSLKTPIISGGLHFSTGKELPKPIIILLTDYISEQFIQFYSSDLRVAMEEFTFRIYTYDDYTYQFFLKNKTVSIENLYFMDPQKPSEVSLKGGPAKDPEEKKEAKKPTPTITETQLVLIVVGSVALLLILLIIGTIIYKQKVTWFNKIERFRNKHQESNSHSLTEVDYFELTWDRLLIKSDRIGSGAYGQVYRGKIHGIPPCVEHMHSDRPHLVNFFENCDVAIKMLPKYATESARKEFMNEIHLMKTIGYSEYIVNMLGCVTVGQAICLVLEFCPNRDLHQYVKTLKIDVNISKSIDIKINYTKEFMLFAWQVSDGMRFLASKHIIHRDLAARNILIDSQKNAKISDFGLCIQLDENYASTNSNRSFVSGSGRLPIKWLSIEALVNHEFSTKSDVWSFGMLLFEMYSFGETPFNEVPPRKLGDHLKQGNRPEKPQLCPDEMYDLMQRCWRELPEKRPTFQEILTQLTLFLENATKEYGYLDLEATTTEEYTKMSKLALAKSFNESGAQNDGTSKKKARVFSSNSNASEHRPHYNHKITSTAAGKISKRHSHSSNQLHNSEQQVDSSPEVVHQKKISIAGRKLFKRSSHSVDLPDSEQDKPSTSKASGKHSKRNSLDSNQIQDLEQVDPPPEVDPP